MNTFLLINNTLMTALVIISYRELVMPGLWRNICTFFPISGFGMFLSVDGLNDPWGGIMSAALLLPVFVGAVFLGAWAEKKLAAHKSEP